MGGGRATGPVSEAVEERPHRLRKHSQVFSEPSFEGTSRRPKNRTASPARSERPLPYPLAAPNGANARRPNRSRLQLR
jgi:hypothetical protein